MASNKNFKKVNMQLVNSNTVKVFTLMVLHSLTGRCDGRDNNASVVREIKLNRKAGDDRAANCQ